MNGLFYFDRFYDRGLRWYEGQFAVESGTELALEVCHDYLFSDAAADRIARHFPDATLLVCVRHPVERAVSSYHYMVRQGRVQSDFSTALRRFDELIDHGRYGHHLRRYLERFALDQLSVHDFACLESDPARFGNDLLEALGLASVPIPDRLLHPVRPAARARFQPAATLGRRTAQAMRERGLESLLARLKNSRLIERALFTRLGAVGRVTPSASDIAFMREELKDDARQLDALLGTDYHLRWWGSDSAPDASLTTLH